MSGEWSSLRRGFVDIASALAAADEVSNNSKDLDAIMINFFLCFPQDWSREKILYYNIHLKSGSDLIRGPEGQPGFYFPFPLRDFLAVPRPFTYTHATSRTSRSVVTTAQLPQLLFKLQSSHKPPRKLPK